MESLEKIIEQICRHGNVSEERVLTLIEEKQDELSGLVSSEGAAYIVAREMGINLLKEGKKQLKIRSIVPGLRSVELIGRILSISDTRHFEKEGKKGAVQNLMLGDETGVVRLSLWNEELGLIKELGLKQGEAVNILRGYVKTDNLGNPELRLGRGRLERLDVKVDVVDLPDADRLKTDFIVARQKNIAALREGEYAEIRAAMVQLFNRNPFYEVCPECSARLKEDSGGWKCDDHGKIEPEYQMVISGVIDDGTGNIRAVLFRDVAEKLFEKSTEELRKIAQKEMNALSVYEHFKNLGRDYIFRGRVKRNSFTENLEFVVNEVRDFDADAVKKEAKMLLSELN